MIPFFRKIRKQFADDNKPLKYMRYAIGEIVLVVIGILIALQINNLNEFRKERMIEKRMLEELVENLEFNTERLENWIKLNNRDDRSSEIIATALENKLPYIDSLNKHFGWATTIGRGELLSKVGYESLKNVGLEIVQNKQLKKYITFLFEGVYQDRNSKMARLERMNIEFVKVRQQRFMRKSGFNFEPFDYANLLNDLHYQSWLATIKNNRGWLTNSLEDSLEETQRVLQLIKDELNE
jgi:hypothetical protein